jgi:hypothetical protein
MLQMAEHIQAEHLEQCGEVLEQGVSGHDHLSYCSLPW